MSAYYNEIDPYAAQWLRNLIAAGQIAPGVVDERSIVDVQPDDLKDFTQCHFFAGIGGWSIALRGSGWADDRPVWTGSCPCQPFSAAGAGKAGNDERHLWPAWFSLIAQRRPPIVFGEQVEAAVGWGWLDLVFSDLEGAGYACGAAVLPACSVGAAHIRQRLWFVGNADSSGEHGQLGREGRAQSQSQGEVGQQEWQRLRAEPGRTGGWLANTDGGNASAERQQRSGEQRQQPQDGGAGELADAQDGDGRRGERGAEARIRQDGFRGGRLASGSETGDLADAAGRGQREQRDASQPRRGGHPDGGFWASAEWITCSDGKSRPIEPGSFPLAHGVQRRPSKLRAYGNAIVPQVATEFVSTFLETLEN